MTRRLRDVELPLLYSSVQLTRLTVILRVTVCNWFPNSNMLHKNQEKVKWVTCEGDTEAKHSSWRSAACLHILNYSSILLKFSLNLKFTWPIRIQGCSSCFGLISLKDWIHFSSAFSWWFAPLADSYTDTARLKIQRCVIALALYTNYLENAASPSAE